MLAIINKNILSYIKKRLLFPLILHCHISENTDVINLLYFLFHQINCS